MAAALTAVLAIGYAIADKVYANKAIQKRAEFAERFGGATYDELRPKPKSLEHDTARIYEYARALLDEATSDIPAESWQTWLSSDPPSPPNADIRAYLSMAQPALDLVLAAARDPDAVFRPIMEGDLPVFHASDIRALTRLTLLKAIVSAFDGDPVTSFECLRAALGMANALDDTPLLITSLNQRAIADMTFLSARKVLAHIQTYPANDTDLISELNDLANPRNAVRMIAGEARMSGDYSAETFPLRLPISLAEIKWVDYTTALDEALKQDTFQEREAIRRVAVKEAVSGPFTLYWTMHMIVPMTEADVENHDIVNANCRQFEIALALCRYRIANGQYPDSLDQLVPEFIESVPIDWFVEGPMIYRKHDSGYTLYSVGPDQQDNDGLERDGLSETYDIVWQIEK
ncbi:MAG: hypothetical protein AMXMBFR84_32790 [Candidatus Hydrogenedentota bacterium]